LVDDLTGLSTHDVMSKVRCEAAEAVRVHYHAKLAAQEAGRKAEKERLKTLRDEFKVLDTMVQELLANYNTHEGEFDRLASRKREIGNLIAALEQVVKELEAKLQNATDPTEIESLRLLIEKAARRIAGVTDEALLVAKLSAQLKEQLDAEGKNAQKKKMERDKRQKKLDDEQKKFEAVYASLDRFDQAALAMNFEFEITENNKASTTGSVTWPVNLGTFTLGWSGGKDRKRVSERIVSTATSFEILKAPEKLGCSNAAIGYGSRRARPYPITGTIGMEEFVNQYFKVSDSIALKTGNEAFRDKLTFTTIIKGGLTPKIELAPVSPSKVSASLDLNADRQDFHEVIVAIYPAESAGGKAAAATTVNIGAVPEVSLRGVRDALDRYLRVGGDQDLR
jgi:hypothetical protein